MNTSLSKDIPLLLVFFSNPQIVFKHGLNVFTLSLPCREPSRFLRGQILRRRILGRQILGRRILGRRILGRRILGRRILGRRILGRRILGRRILGRRILGRRILGRRTLGRRTLGRRTLGRRILGRYQERRRPHGARLNISGSSSSFDGVSFTLSTAFSLKCEKIY